MSRVIYLCATCSWVSFDYKDIRFPKNIIQLSVANIFQRSDNFWDTLYSDEMRSDVDSHIEVEVDASDRVEVDGTRLAHAYQIAEIAALDPRIHL